MSRIPLWWCHRPVFGREYVDHKFYHRRHKAFYEGAGVCANGSSFDDDVRAVHIINCTIAGNACSADPSELYAEDTETGTVTNPGSWLGSQIRIACDPAVNICNSIIVGRDDDGAVAKAAIVLPVRRKHLPALI